MPAGRPSKLTRELVDKAGGYVANCIGELPTLEGLALYLAVDRTTIYDWTEKNTPLAVEFSHIFEDIKAEQAKRLINGGLYGRFNATITKLMLTKHGYVEKTEVDQNLSGAVTFTNSVPRPKRDGSTGSST